MHVYNVECHVLLAPMYNKLLVNVRMNVVASFIGNGEMHVQEEQVALKKLFGFAYVLDAK